jgi:hypothetical protein
MNNVLSLQLARERAQQPRGGSNVHTFIPVGLSVNQRLLERLEAENAVLRGSVVVLIKVRTWRHWSEPRSVPTIKTGSLLGLDLSELPPGAQRCPRPTPT